MEIPWALSRLPAGPGALLDAGSSLNHAFVVGYCQGQGWKLHVLTLAPESRCFWDRGVSYVYGDLRRTVFADDAFGAVVCISTIEHVGMDNSFYAGAAPSARPGDAWEFLAAVKELKRVLEPGRALYITFPFGRHEDHGWFQQLDAGRVDRLVDAFGPVRASETVFGGLAMKSISIVLKLAAIWLHFCRLSPRLKSLVTRARRKESSA